MAGLKRVDALLLNLIGKIRQGYARHHQYVHVSMPHARQWLKTLSFLHASGFIQHFELVKSKRCNGLPVFQVRILLAYQGGMLAPRLFLKRHRGVGMAAVSARSLARLGAKTNGATLLVATPVGILTHFSALEKNKGGILLGSTNA
jgi:ribosomal protein S8